MSGRLSLVRLKAPAKINLGLRVLRRRPDGYHAILTLMQTVALYDRVTVERERRPGVRLRLSGLALPPGKNLAVAAAEILLAGFSSGVGIRIFLQKRIPVGAGLGGGSSDAAATLAALNRLLDLRLANSQLAKIGEEIGADVPFFFYGPTAIASGRGEILNPVRWAGPSYAALYTPPFPLSTRSVYLEYDRLPSLTKTGAQNSIVSLGVNDLEAAVFPRHPLVARLKERLALLGGKGAAMSGSGPTVFALFSRRSRASLAVRTLKREFPGGKGWVVRLLKRAEF